MGKPQKREKKKEPVSLVHQQVQEIHYQGPVPPPAILDRLENLLPGAADRIFTMAEKEQDASHEHQRKQDDGATLIVKNEHSQNMIALIFAFIICLVFVISGTVLVLYGHEKLGAFLIGTTLLGVTSSFLARWKHVGKK